uniref:Uncharacterized protein n=1 Tax=Pseudonaja textilis TaxID=8673 RepID=A0A670ZIA4_PSETE
LLQRYCQALETAVGLSVKHNMHPIPGRTLILISNCYQLEKSCVQGKNMYCPTFDRNSCNDQKNPMTVGKHLSIVIQFSLFFCPSFGSGPIGVWCPLYCLLGNSRFQKTFLTLARFMSECGNSRFLEHVGKVDEIHGLPKQQRTATAQWRSVRVFVSSTFRDMHGERDLLIRSVFPELRARAARFCLAIQEIDLRWGITEHESQRNKQVELCLSEVSRSDLFIGILGERYGHVPKETSLPEEPQYEWVRDNMDVNLGIRLSLSLSSSVPEAWKKDFGAESEEAAQRMADLKGHLRKHGSLAAFSSYSCQWGGVAQGQPFVKGLEDFGHRVMLDVWKYLQHHFIEVPENYQSSSCDISEEEGNALQESFQESQQRRFCARMKLLNTTTARMRGGKLYVVSGEPGQGKTVFLVSKGKVEAVGRSGKLGTRHGDMEAQYRAIALRFIYRFTDHIFPWLCFSLQRVSLVLSVSADSTLLESLKQRKDTIFIPLEPLAPPDRAAIVRKDLAQHGKKLEESAFNNQVNQACPLYLSLLIQDLRLFALYEKLSERIKKLPISLPLMMQHLLGCLEQDHGLELVTITLVSLWASRDGTLQGDVMCEYSEGHWLWSKTKSICLLFLPSLLGACGSPSELPGSRLQLCGAPVRMAVEQRYLKKPGLEHTAHVFLVQSGRLDILASFLTDLKVIGAHLHLGLLRNLSEAYALYAAGSEPNEAVNLFSDFLQRNFGLLSQNPLLLLQQAANEPSSSDLCLQAQEALWKCGKPFLKWINKPERAHVEVIPPCAFLSETTVCLGAFNGRFELWSLREGCRILSKDAHKAQITDCCISSDCKLLASVSLDSTLKLWEAAQGHVLHQWNFPCPLNCVTFHPKNQLVAIGGWDRSMATFDHRCLLQVMEDHDASIRCISFSSTGKVLAAGTLVGSITLWSWQENIILGSFKAHSGCTSVARFLSNEELLTAGEDCKVQICKGHLGQFWSTLGSRTLSPALCMASNLDGSRLAVGHHSDGIWIYSFQTTPIHLQGSHVAVCSLAWLHHVFLVAGLGDGSLCVWKTFESSSDCCHKFKAHEKAVMGLGVSDKLVASVSEDFTIGLWLSETLRPAPALDASISPLSILRGHTSGVTCCAFSLDGNYLATGSKDRALFLWDVRDPLQKTPSLLRSLLFCHQDWISSCAWIGTMLLSGSNDGTVCLWDMTTSERVQKFLGHQSPICGITTEKDHVISMGRDGLLITWNLQGVEETRFLAHPSQTNHCTGFRDPCKRFLGTVLQKRGSVLKIEQPQVLFGHSASVYAAAATSSSFLTISKDKSARIWAVPKNDDDTKHLPPHQGAVTAVAWSPDGNLSASGGEHGDLIVWQGRELWGTAKVAPRCISALTFHSSHTLLVACDGISLWDISDRMQNVKAVR